MAVVCDVFRQISVFAGSQRGGRITTWRPVSAPEISGAIAVQMAVMTGNLVQLPTRSRVLDVRRARFGTVFPWGGHGRIPPG
jgi:hypothetical protein